MAKNANPSLHLTFARSAERHNHSQGLVVAHSQHSEYTKAATNFAALGGESEDMGSVVAMFTLFGSVGAKKSHSVTEAY